MEPEELAPPNPYESPEAMATWLMHHHADKATIAKYIAACERAHHVAGQHKARGFWEETRGHVERALAAEQSK